jgi:hypothetical protein
VLLWSKSRHPAPQDPEAAQTIDVWWQNDATSRLMLLFAYLMTRTKPWEASAIRVLTKGTGANIEIEKTALKQILEDVRIEAEAVVVPSFEPEVVTKNSQDAGMVFLPFALRAHKLTDPTGESFQKTLPQLCLAALVLAAEDIDLDSEPEEGTAALIAAATDALDAARKKSAKADKQAETARNIAEKLHKKLIKLETGDSGAIPLEAHKELKQKLDSAESDAQKAFRRAAKAKIKAEDVAKTVENGNDSENSKL